MVERHIAHVMQGPLPSSCVGLDLGGSLCKICVFERTPRSSDSPQERTFRETMQCLIKTEATYGSTGQRDQHLELDSSTLGGRLYFMQFETRRMESFLSMLRRADQLKLDANTVICATGGGARKYSPEICDLFGRDIPRSDELTSVVTGLNCLLHCTPRELFRVDHATYRWGRMAAPEHNMPTMSESGCRCTEG